MTREETINLADKWLKRVPTIRQRIRLIDIALKMDTYDMATIEKLKQERHKLNYRLNRIITAINALSDENQRIICYRYFENVTYKNISIRVNLGERTIYRRIDKCLLEVGRAMFGFEEEFWHEVGWYHIG